MMSTDEKLDNIILRLERIEKHFEIVPDREISITDFESSVESYEQFAKDELHIDDGTIRNQRSTIFTFLRYSEGIITKDTVKLYLDSNESASWKSNQLKALRRYIRDFLQLGKWIEEFEFKKTKAKIRKAVPSDSELVDFYMCLECEIQLVFLTLLTTGFRIGEVLKIKVKDINFETGAINASEYHEGQTKHSWISFLTRQTLDLISEHIHSELNFENAQDWRLFSVSSRTVQNAFKKASEATGVLIKPHLLRTVFSEKCVKSGMKDKYINAFCGRTPQGVLNTNYTDYSPEALRIQYDKVEYLLELDL